MRPFDRLSIDFKGPLASNTKNMYLFIAIDEYSRFPFAIPCSDMTTSTVISCLISIFSVFGLPNYVHSDHGAAIKSKELREFLHGKGVASSRSTPYHPIGNGQCERYVGIIWKTITLALHSKRLANSDWECVLPDALHSLRSLLRTTTNETPHERLFSYSRRTASGSSLLSWLSSPGTVLLRNHVRRKDEPLVQEVELLECNPNFAHIQYPSSRQDTVALKDLAPFPSKISDHEESSEVIQGDVPLESGENLRVDSSVENIHQEPRRSARSRFLVDRLSYKNLGGE